jgi:hypothetical protein
VRPNPAWRSIPSPVATPQATRAATLRILSRQHGRRRAGNNVALPIRLRRHAPRLWERSQRVKSCRSPAGRTGRRREWLSVLTRRWTSTSWPGDDGPLCGPVRLELPPGLHLEAHRRPARPERPLRPDVVSQDRAPGRVALGLELAPDHHGVPHPLGEELIHDGPVRIQHAAAPAPSPPRGPTALQSPPDSLRMHSQLLGDVTEVDTPSHRTYQHPVRGRPTPDAEVPRGTGRPDATLRAALARSSAPPEEACDALHRGGVTLARAVCGQLIAPGHASRHEGREAWTQFALERFVPTALPAWASP